MYSYHTKSNKISLTTSQSIDSNIFFEYYCVRCITEWFYFQTDEFRYNSQQNDIDYFSE